MKTETIHFDGPCPFLLCLETGPHDHPKCPECGAVNFGNLYCQTCEAEGGKYRDELIRKGKRVINMIIYKGYRDSAAGHQLVTKDDDLLMPGPSQKVWNHSPTGFEWGYGGSGPAQLALAILLDVTGDAELATRYHQEFKWEFVARWKDGWQITSEQVKAWLDEKQKLKAE